MNIDNRFNNVDDPTEQHRRGAAFAINELNKRDADARLKWLDDRAQWKNEIRLAIMYAREYRTAEAVRTATFSVEMAFAHKYITERERYYYIDQIAYIDVQDQ